MIFPRCVHTYIRQHLHMSTKNKVATTVKVQDTLYDEFKVLGVHYKLTLQGLVEKAVYRYVRDEGFRNELNKFIVPPLSASYVPSSSLA